MNEDQERMTQIELFIRAFWRRINSYKGKFDKELPSQLPVEFKWAIDVSLGAIDDEIAKNRLTAIRATEQQIEEEVIAPKELASITERCLGALGNLKESQGQERKDFESWHTKEYGYNQLSGHSNSLEARWNDRGTSQGDIGGSIKG